MDADSSSSVTDSDDDPSPIKTSFGNEIGSAKAGSKHFFEIESSAGAMEEVDENTVLYRIYALPSLGATTESADGGSINSENLATLRAFAYNLCKDYIWHNEPFRLCCKDAPTRHFCGRTNFGENTEDEWFITYLLFEISKNFPDYVISVVDSDGQFLLIEAADYVPSWLDGDIAENRVFIFRGALHVVPLSKHMKPCPRSLSDSTIKQLLIDEPARVFAILQGEHLIRQSLASDSIQRMVMKRIEGYPEKIASQRHRVNCVLPAKVVALLNETGSFFLAAAVHLSCQNNAKMQSQGFSLDFSSTDLITTSVTFSKHLYAKLSCAKQIPDYDCSDWKLPKKNAVGFKANELGMKLTKGLELLCKKAAAQKKVVEDENAADDSRSKFVEVLHIIGCFESTPEGSRRHDRLMKRAQLYYQTQAAGNDGERYMTLLGTKLLETLENLDVVCVDALRLEYPPQEEDDDEWMNMTPEKLEALLSDKWFGNHATKTSSTSGSPTVNSSGVASNGSAMTNGEHQAGPSVIPKRAAQKSSVVDDRMSTTAKGAETGPEVFGDSIKRMLDLQIPHDGDDSSDMESYGDDVPDLGLDGKDAVAAMNTFADNLKQYVQMIENETKTGSGGSSTKPKHARNHAKAHEREKTAKASKTAPGSAHSPGCDSIDFEDDDFTPVYVDKKLVSNVLESYFPEACGQCSSASSLLHGDRSVGNRRGRGKRDHK